MAAAWPRTMSGSPWSVLPVIVRCIMRYAKQECPQRLTGPIQTHCSIPGTEAGSNWQLCRTMQDCCQLPRQVVRILDAGIHAKAAGWREAVRRVASQQHVALQTHMMQQGMSNEVYRVCAA